MPKIVKNEYIKLQSFKKALTNWGVSSAVSMVKYWLRSQIKILNKDDVSSTVFFSAITAVDRTQLSGAIKILVKLLAVLLE